MLQIAVPLQLLRATSQRAITCNGQTIRLTTTFTATSASRFCYNYVDADDHDGGGGGGCCDAAAADDDGNNYGYCNNDIEKFIKKKSSKINENQNEQNDHKHENIFSIELSNASTKQKNYQ